MDTATATDTVRVEQVESAEARELRRARGVVAVGDFVRRLTGDPIPQPLYHRVESVVDGAAITKCGRRMERQNGRGQPLFIYPKTDIPPDWTTCRRC